MNMNELVKALGTSNMAIVDSRKNVLAVNDTVRSWVDNNENKYFLDPDGPRTMTGEEMAHFHGVDHIHSNEAYVVIYVCKRI